MWPPKDKIFRFYNDIYCLVDLKSGINSKLAASPCKTELVCFEYSVCLERGSNPGLIGRNGQAIPLIDCDDPISCKVLNLKGLKCF